MWIFNGNVTELGDTGGSPGKSYLFSLTVYNPEISLSGARVQWLVEHNSSVVSGSQMPRHLISDAHEWINEIPTVPIYYLAKPQPRERAWQNQRGKKTLLSLTLV
ncbi:hypothetical protein EYR38_004884 [Pleurotus pulmonarius]|nr:hypothetical protein EYR38_004884 [Pleurotus pulmonarius]